MIERPADGRRCASLAREQLSKPKLAGPHDLADVAQMAHALETMGDGSISRRSLAARHTRLKTCDSSQMLATNGFAEQRVQVAEHRTKLARIAWPTLRRKGLDDGGSQRGAGIARDRLPECLREQRNVLALAVDAGGGNEKRLQPVIEVLAKRPALTSAARSRMRAVRTRARTLTSRPPTGRTLPSCRLR